MIREINNLKDKKVLVIGNIKFDYYINVVPRKISEEDPLSISNFYDKYYNLGGCANVAKYKSWKK